MSALTGEGMIHAFERECIPMHACARATCMHACMSDPYMHAWACMETCVRACMRQILTCRVANCMMRRSAYHHHPRG